MMYIHIQYTCLGHAENVSVVTVWCVRYNIWW